MEFPSTVPVSIENFTAPDARLHVEVRGHGPVLALIGCPMDADAFGPLADQMAADHTVITTDPRGINRSTVDNPDRDVTPEMLADDLALILGHLGISSAAVFGSSGGAVSALALAIAHPTLVHTVVAHEPPLDELLADSDRLRAETDDIVATYLSGDVAGAWAKFLAQANIDVGAKDLAADRTVEPDPQVVADERFFFEHTLRPSTRWQPDLEALRTGWPRIVVGIGDASSGQSCDHTSRALAAALGVAPINFPGDHIGFTRHPGAFATLLRVALAPVDARPTS